RVPGKRQYHSSWTTIRRHTHQLYGSGKRIMRKLREQQPSSIGAELWIPVAIGARKQRLCCVGSHLLFEESGLALRIRIKNDRLAITCPAGRPFVPALLA